MGNRKQQIDDFFNHYSDIFNKAVKKEISGIDKTTELYSDAFIGANPKGVECGKNDKTLEDFLTKGYAFYRKIGITSMEIASKEITILDDFHTMTKVRWIANYTKKDDTQGSIEFDNIYFTQTKENQHKVFAWITGDEQAVLKEIGLV